MKFNISIFVFRLSRDADGFQSKMRRLDDLGMPRCSSPLEDLDSPSSSKNPFKKPLFPTSKSFMRASEIIDLSDDDDLEFRPKKNDSSHSSSTEEWIEQPKKGSYWERSNFFRRYRVQNEMRHKSVLQKAKNTLAKNSIFTSRTNHKQSTSSLNESVRMDDLKKYKQMLDSFTNSVGSLPLKFMNGSAAKKSDKTEKPMSFSELYKKQYNESCVAKVIDLTDDGNKPKTISIDSDSDSDVRIISQKICSPVNSLKKRLEIEPVMNERWISQW